ncbi:MAG: 3-isopropylmalate dehydratase large subunit, partial [Thermovirga sp.]|nr:3-isopropylmalate dehydratase large subunit [Thermovirga sp.]
MGKTFAEKVLGKAAGEPVSAGQVVIVEPHFCMSHDNAAPIWGIFQKIGVNKVWKPDHLVFILDHAIPAPTDKHAENHMKIRQVVKEQ